MTRLLFWIALVILVVMAVRSKLRAALNAQSPGPAAVPPSAGTHVPQAQARADMTGVERMACCARCGVHFPSSEAVSAGGREYCCAAHAQA